jgi:hypothetical protein
MKFSNSVPTRFMSWRRDARFIGTTGECPFSARDSVNTLQLTALSFLHRSASYIVRSMRVLPFMENLLAIEAETKVLLSASDRAYEQTLMQELLKIFKEAELLFGPRDASYQLSIPRSTKCASSRTYIFRPLRMARIYLSRDSRIKPWLGSDDPGRGACRMVCPEICEPRS